MEAEALILTNSFIRDEEEGFVLLDGASDRPSKLAAMERWQACVKEVFSVKDFIAIEQKGVPMELISPRFSNCIDDCARGASVFRGVISSNDRELLNRVDAQRSS